MDPLPRCPPGTWFVSPVEDVQLLGLQLVDLLVHTVRTRVARRPSLDPAAGPPSFVRQLRSFAGTYARGRHRVWDPYSRYVLQDPVVSILWWLQFSSWVAGALSIVVFAIMAGLAALMERAMEFYRAGLKKAPRAIEYLKGRGLTGQVAARFGLGYAPDEWNALHAPA